MKIREIISEVASVGATSAANIATVASPHIAVGPDRFKKSYTGTPGKSGTKAPRLPKIVQPKKKDGTAKGAHALPGVSIFCLLYTSPSPRDYAASRMPSSA